MIEETQNPEATEEARLTKLKERADMLGIKYSNNIKAETLAAKIDATLGTTEEAVDDSKLARMEASRIRQEKIKDAKKLIRINLQCMNPAKKDWPGEIITTGNKTIGTVKWYVPFQLPNDDGYHVPQCILNVLKERVFQEAQRYKLQDGTPATRFVSKKEFGISILPPLTEKELADLAKAQAARG